MGTRACKNCGKPLKTGKKYCSIVCLGQAKRGKQKVKRETMQCQFCKKVFECPPSWARNGRRKFCSRDCKHKHQRTIRGKDHPMWGRRHTEESKRKMSLHTKSNNLRGADHPAWKGGRYVCKSYLHVLITQRSKREQNLARQMVKGCYILEHRLVMAVKLNRPLKRREEVHHVNGKKLDNRLTNLEVYPKRGHSRKHRSVERLLSRLRTENRKLRAEIKRLKS